MEEENNIVQVLYFYNGKYYTLRREVHNKRQYFITLVEVEINSGSDD